MNREIKFRGYDDKNNKWAFGYYAVQNGRKWPFHIIITTDLDNDFNYIKNLVDARSVGQYTGLKDNRGVEIYEGDILEVINSTGSEIYEWVVKFSEGGWYAYAHSLHELPLWASFNVIGNIHENPELIE